MAPRITSEHYQQPNQQFKQAKTVRGGDQRNTTILGRYSYQAMLLQSVPYPGPAASIGQRQYCYVSNLKRINHHFSNLDYSTKNDLEGFLKGPLCRVRNAIEVLQFFLGTLQLIRKKIILTENSRSYRNDQSRLLDLLKDHSSVTTSQICISREVLSTTV